MNGLKLSALAVAAALVVSLSSEAKAQVVVYGAYYAPAPVYAAPVYTSQVPVGVYYPPVYASPIVPMAYAAPAPVYMAPVYAPRRVIYRPWLGVVRYRY